MADRKEHILRPATGNEWVITLSCADRPGIVAAVSTLLAEAGGNITESQQFGDPETGLFFLRVQVRFPPAADAMAEPPISLAAIAASFEMTWSIDRVDRPMRTVILASREAHCVTDLLFRARDGRLPVDIAAIVSNHEDLADLAAFYDVPFHHIPVRAETKEAAENDILELIAALDAELVVLARYMQILSDRFCTELSGRIINIHHSFLPSFKGARPYAQAHRRGVKLIGATAHYVTADLDEGPIIEQDVERVDHAHTVNDLVAVGQDVERRTLARAVRWHAEHRILLNGSRTVVFR